MAQTFTWRGQTHVPKHFPDTNWSYDMNDSRASIKLTITLATICKLSLVVQEDVIAYMESRCWEDQVAGVRFSPRDFVAAADYYREFMMRKCSYIAQDMNTKGYGNVESSFTQKDPPKFSTIRELVDFCSRLIRGLQGSLRTLSRVLSASNVNLSEVMTTGDTPTACPREILFWGILNTRSYRKELSDAAESSDPSDGERILKNLLARLQDQKPKPSPEYPTVYIPSGIKNSQFEIDTCLPSVFFMCSGISPLEKGSGGAARTVHHNTTHVAASPEKFRSWPEFYEIRNTARDLNIGSAEKSKWNDFFRDLVNFEDEALLGGSGNREDRRLRLRKDIIDNKVVPENLVQRFGTLRYPIYDCSDHLGQSFLEAKAGRKPINLCYICQMTLKFRVGNCSDDEDQYLRAFKLRNRARNPASCAEVICGLICHSWKGESEA